MVYVKAKILLFFMHFNVIMRYELLSSDFFINSELIIDTIDYEIM